METSASSSSYSTGILGRWKIGSCRNNFPVAKYNPSNALSDDLPIAVARGQALGADSRLTAFWTSNRANLLPSVVAPVTISTTPV